MSIREPLRKAAKAARLLSHPLWRRGLLRGIAASVEHDALPLRRNFQTVIDVGANRGQFALYARARFPEATVFCFEPLPGPLRRLRYLFADESRVRIFPLALGAEPGRSSMNVARRDDSSSLLGFTDLQSRRFPGTDVVGVEPVVVSTLDLALAQAELQRPLLLKLDVQGFELESLRGSTETMKSVDAILCECSFVQFYDRQPLHAEIENFVRDAGFVEVAVNATAWGPDGKVEQADVLFARSPHDSA